MAKASQRETGAAAAEKFADGRGLNRAGKQGFEAARALSHAKSEAHRARMIAGVDAAMGKIAEQIPGVLAEIIKAEEEVTKLTRELTALYNARPTDEAACEVKAAELSAAEGVRDTAKTKLTFNIPNAPQDVLNVLKAEKGSGYNRLIEAARGKDLDLASIVIEPDPTGETGVALPKVLDKIVLSPHDRVYVPTILSKIPIVRGAFGGKNAVKATTKEAPSVVTTEVEAGAQTFTRHQVIGIMQQAREEGAMAVRAEAAMADAAARAVAERQAELEAAKQAGRDEVTAAAQEALDAAIAQMKDAQREKEEAVAAAGRDERERILAARELLH